MTILSIEITKIFQYWINTHWYIALLMSFITNVVVYSVAASSLSFTTNQLNTKNLFGKFIDKRDLKERQVEREIFYGVFACFVFSITSLLARGLFNNLWPESLLNFVVQLFAFSLFYESYSYFIHRLLHTKLFIKVHSVHHTSVRVTPWSAYSVHPVEALFIGISAPLFMLLFPMSLSVILFLHILGMIFTLFLHSNFMVNDSVLFSSTINKYTNAHLQHHKKGGVNFGFVNSFWDKIFRTNFRDE